MTMPLPARAEPFPSRPSALAGALLAAGLVAAWPVRAQQQAAPAEPATAVLDTVTVTSDKRPGSQRNVAGTVSELTGVELEALGVLNQEGALQLTPGVQLNKGNPGQNNISIRGITTQGDTESAGAQQAPTGIYLQDVPLNAPIGRGLIVDPLPWDLERIEVLRGPQGALFGSGSLGGALRYIYANPNLKSFEASAMVGYTGVAGGGGWSNAASVFGMVNAPLAEGAAAVRAVAYDSNAPGWIDNIGTNTLNGNKSRQTGGRVLFTVKPTNDFSATIVGSTTEWKQDDRFFVSPNPDVLQHNAPTNGTATSRFDFASLTMDYDFSGHRLTSITGYWKTTSNGVGDDTELLASLGFVVPSITRPFDNSSHATSQELRIASTSGGPLSYVVGAFYQTISSQGAAQQIVNGAADIFGSDPFSLVDLSTQAGGTESAIFFDGDYAFANGWGVGLGGRYYRTTTRYRQAGVIFPDPYTVVDVPNGSDSGTTPKVSVKYRFDNDNLWYALASKGYRFGGVNTTPPYSPYESDSLWNYETGVRLNVATGLQVDLTAFYLDWTNAQFTFYDTSAVIPSSQIGNVGKARSVGLEAVARYRVNSALDFRFSVAYTNAETTTDVVRSPTDTLKSGSPLPGVPNWQTALQGNLNFAGPFESQGRAWFTHTYVGSRVTDLGGNYIAPSFMTLNLGTSFFAQNNWTLSVLLNNALNERGIMSRTGSPFNPAFGQYYLQQPRTLNVSLRYDY